MNKLYLETIINIVRTGHKQIDELSLVLKEFDISEPQFNVLRILRGAKGEALAVQDISDRMIQRSSNVTRIIDKLLKHGYVQRMECKTNRRKMDIMITAEGLRFLKKLDKKVEPLQLKYANNLNEKELKTLNKLINKLIPDEEN